MRKRTMAMGLALWQAVGAWDFDKPYLLPELPLLAQEGTKDTAFAFAAEKTGSPKAYARTAVPLRIAGFGCLARDPSDASGSTFWTLDDRGVSTPYEAGSTKARVFALPGYHQKLVKWRLEEGALRVMEIDSIASLEAATVFTTGLPSSKVPLDEPAWKGRLDAALVDPTAAVAAVPHGYDFEGLRVAPSGNFVVSDELGPSLVEIERATKRIVKEWIPGKGIPKVFAKRRSNRGFEAVAVAPSGKMLAMLQSPADNWSGGDSKDSRMLRVLRLDPATGAANEYVYLLDLKGGKRAASETKIGDAVALSETRFLAIEHGKDAAGKYWIDLVEFDIAGATDIHDPDDKAKGRMFAVGFGVPTTGSLTPEQIGMDTSTAVWASAGIVPVTKAVVIGDLLASRPAWTGEAPEGLEILGDSAVALLDDDDYGVQDKNSDGIPHLRSAAERGEHLVFLRFPGRTGVGPVPLRASGWRVVRAGRELRVFAPEAGNGTLRLCDLSGRILSSGAVRGGVGAVSLAGVPAGVAVLRLDAGSGAAARVVEIVR